VEASLLPHFDSTIRKKALAPAKWKRELTKFFECADACATAMDKSIRAKALGNWLAKSHELRLSAAHIGARKLAGFCTEAEQIRSLRNESARALHYHIEKEIAYLRRHID